MTDMIREPPVGSSDSDSYHDGMPQSVEKIKLLEQERDNLQKNMISLTSRMAQIEFRMSQALTNDCDDKDELLRSLSQFVSSPSAPLDENSNTGEYLSNLSTELRQQLDEVERLAVDRGVDNRVTSETLERQRESLRIISEKLGLKGDEVLTLDSASSAVDDAVKNLLMPQVEKEKLVEQLQTKVQDLERFIEFIQLKQPDDLDLPKVPKENNRSIISKGVTAIIRIGSLLPIPVLRNFGCSGKAEQLDAFSSTSTKSNIDDSSSVCTQPPTRTSNNNKRSEVIKPPEIRDLQHTVNLVKLASQRLRMMDKKRDESTNQQEKLISVVRKQLSFSIAKIVAHQFKLETSYLTSAVALVASPINGCFRGDYDNDKLIEEHAWMVIWTFFELRDGHILIQAPKSAPRHAFGIHDPLLGRNEAERKMLRCIYEIYSSHEKYKSTKMSMFRAFICHGLNNNQLTTWLHSIIYELRREHYYPNAFVVKHGYEQFLSTLLPLDKLSFNLPANLAIRNLDEINHAF